MKGGVGGGCVCWVEDIILYKIFSFCVMTWKCVGIYIGFFQFKNKKKRLQYAQKIYIVYTRLNELDNRKALAK